MVHLLWFYEYSRQNPFNTELKALLNGVDNPFGSKLATATARD